MRSKLFVPGARPELFAKALAGDADALSFDLEDSVSEDGKDTARAAIAAFLDDPALAVSPKCVIVRTNAPDSPHFTADMMAMAHRRVDLLNVPKLESVADVRRIVESLEQAEARAGIDTPISLLLNIETPTGLRLAAELAAADARVAGLQLGLADLFAVNGVARTPINVHAALFALKMAAAEAGVFAYDSAWPNVSDEAGFQTEAALAKDLGFLGKSCIHPRQVAWANAAFSVDPARLDEARRIVDAAATQTNGRGAFLFEGRMIDTPFLRQARMLLAADRTTSR